MLRRSFVRTAALALIFYGVLGFFVAGAMLMLGHATFSELERWRTALTSERGLVMPKLRDAIARSVRETQDHRVSTHHLAAE